MTVRKGAPMPMAAAPMHTQTKPSLGQIVKEGAAFGVGTTVARHAVDGVLEMFTKNKPEDPCSVYKECLQKADRDICNKLFVQCAPLRDLE